MPATLAGLLKTPATAVQNNAYTAPVVSVKTQTAAQKWVQGISVSFSLASTTFADSQNKALTYSATLANGSALPSWLKFNAVTETFSGVVPAGVNGFSIKVTATDTSGVSASETFAVTTPAPVVNLSAQTAAQTWKQGTVVSVALPASTFTDSAVESLTYTAKQANGAALPSWLSFNAATKTFSGTVPAGASNLSIMVTATDAAGAKASETFSVSAPAPVVSLSTLTAAQTWKQGTAVSFALPAGTFTDSANEVLTYTATQANGSALPSWLTLNAATGIFSGAVPAGASGVSIKVTATDVAGVKASETFTVTTPAPVVSLSTQTANQTWTQGKAISLALPAGTFTDSAGEALTYTATLASGAALPSWLTFNAATQIFTGNVPAGASGLSINVTATDVAGVKTSETFAVSTPAPVVSLSAQTANQTWTQGKATSLSLSASTFTDSAGEVLTYTATQANGTALPDWLTFNAATQTFSGNVPGGTNGVSLKVTAADVAGVSASETLSIATPAPVVSVSSQTAAQTWQQGSLVSFTVPAGTFADSANEALTYSATGANGSALPSWLTFNAGTGTFSGTVANSTSGLSLKVTATDAAGISASETISVITPAVGVVPAMRAANFLGTMGVNTHIPYTDGLYANNSQVISDLAYLGVTQIRDTVSNSGSALYSSYLKLAQAGVHFTFFIPGSIATSAALQSDISEIATLNQAVPGSVTAVEGPNEINNWPVSFNGVGGLQGALNMQSTIYSLVHSNPALAGVSVDYFTGYGEGGLQVGPNPATTAGLADFDTAHPYPPAGKSPASSISPALLNNLGNVGPEVYTETGYSTVGTGSGVVNQDVQAKYTIDLLLDDAKAGVSKTYLYQLMDAYAPGSPQGDDGFGLFDYTGTPKAAATAIHNLTSILEDPASTSQNFTMGKLDYSVQGLPSTANSMLMEKSSGAYDLAIWNEPALWNPSTKQELSVTPTAISVVLGNTASKIEVYDPLVSSNPIQVLTNTNTIQLSLTGDPLIIQIEPSTISSVASLMGQAISSVGAGSGSASSTITQFASTSTQTLATPMH